MSRKVPQVALLRLSALSLAALLALTGADQAAAQAAGKLVIEEPLTEGRRSIELQVRSAFYYNYDWFTELYVDRFLRAKYWGNRALGPGVQVLIPVLHNGPIPFLNNALYVGAFADLLVHNDAFDSYSNYFLSLTLGGLVQWRFVFAEFGQGGSASAFVNLGFGIWPWLVDAGSGYRGVGTVVYGFPLAEVGAVAFFTKRLGASFSFGYPSTKIGLNIAF